MRRTVSLSWMLERMVARDAGVFGNSTMMTVLENGTFGIPEERPLPGRMLPGGIKKMKFVIIGDKDIKYYKTFRQGDFVKLRYHQRHHTGGMIN